MGKLFAGLLAGNPLHLIGAAVVIALAAGVAGAVGGWKVNGWRTSGQIEHLQGENSAYQTANSRCSIDVDAVKGAVRGVLKLAEDRDKAARAAMLAATAEATDHLNTAAEILNRPQVPPEKQCDTVRDEQREFVRARKKQAQPSVRSQ